MFKINKLRDMLIANLGSPYYENNNCLLFCVDTLEAIKEIEPSIFNAVITSPAYNLGKEYEEDLTIEQYISWSSNWINGVSKLINENGTLLLNLGYIKLDEKARAIPIPYLLWDKIPMYLNQEIVWNYSEGVACKNYLSPRNEKILWYVKDKENYTFNLDSIRDKNVKYPNSKKNGKLRVNFLGKNPSDVWEIAKVTTGTNRSSIERTPHPCQFPLDLINRLVNGFTNSEDVVFDPFIGSGTTFESCVINNRYCIGFEIRKDYCDIICDRIEFLMSQSSLLSFV